MNAAVEWLETGFNDAQRAWNSSRFRSQAGRDYMENFKQAVQTMTHVGGMFKFKHDEEECINQHCDHSNAIVVE